MPPLAMPRRIHELVLDALLRFVQKVKIVDEPLPRLFFLFRIKRRVGFIFPIEQT